MKTALLLGKLEENFRPRGLISVLIEFLDRIRPTSGYLILMDFLGGRRKGLTRRMEENSLFLSLSLYSYSDVIEEEGNVNLELRLITISFPPR